MPDSLSERQQAVIEFIRKEMGRRGVFPSIMEFGAALGIRSTRGVTDHLDALERKGWIERTGSKGSARSWRLVPDAEVNDGLSARSVPLPLIGTVAAGSPIFADEAVEDVIAVPLALADTSTECFVLRIKGDSMIGDAICDGDLAVLRRQNTARSGDIVAVLLDDEATLKHFVKIGTRIELHASNEKYAPIPVTQENALIVGKLIGLLREYR